jgi:hypothetical protein
MKEAWEEEQMSNLGCESVSDLIAEVKRLRKELAHYTDNCTIVWMPEDVLSLDDTLTDEDVSWILSRMEHKHDACLGISWDTIEFYISEVKKND